MKARISKSFVAVVCVVFMSICGAAWGMDEAILTPTDGASGASAAAGGKANSDKEFNDAMAVWFSHKYKDGEKLLREFSKKHPDSRWAAASTFSMTAMCRTPST